MKILVISCDKYKDIFEPFHYCMEKYWPDHPEVYYSTETLENPYYKTISFNGEWTTRVEYAVDQIDDDYILMMCDDVFIRKPVNKERIKYIEDIVKNLDEFCQISFISERLPAGYWKWSPVENVENIGLRYYDKYSNTVNCTLWKKDMLMKCLMGDPLNVWEFEEDGSRFFGKYYISTYGDWPISWGREDCKREVGLVQGKWTREAIEFFNNEGYNIDFSLRGII